MNRGERRRLEREQRKADKQMNNEGKELLEILETNKDNLEKLQEIVGEIVGEEVGSKALKTIGVICATIIHGIDTNVAQDKALEMTKLFLESQRG